MKQNQKRNAKGRAAKSVLRLPDLEVAKSAVLAPGTVNLRLGAVRRLAYQAADCGLLGWTSSVLRS